MHIGAFLAVKSAMDQGELASVISWLQSNREHGFRTLCAANAGEPCQLNSALRLNDQKSPVVRVAATFVFNHKKKLPLGHRIGQ